MYIRLTDDEIREALTKYAASKTGHLTLEETILDTCQFKVTGFDGEELEAAQIEFEYSS